MIFVKFYLDVNGWPR